MKSKFSIMTVALSGSWKDHDCSTLKEAVKRAYLMCLEHSCRYCSISRLDKKNNVYYSIANLAGLNGRVWISKIGKLSEVIWKGKEPSTSDAIELTGKYEPPTNYTI